ncbi:hypothetical protein BGZ54_004201, partial [Gamsiella multidivaricata]
MAYYQNNMFNHLIQSDVGLGMDEEDSDFASHGSGGTSTHQTYPWSNYSLPQLRELLRQRGQLTTGSKAALKKRLKNLERSTKAVTSGQPATTINISGQQPGQEADVPV